MSLRAKSRRRVHEVPLDDLDRAGAILAIPRDGEHLPAALKHLTPDQRVILALHHFEDLPLAQIAEVLSIPVGTAKSRLFKARAVLLRALREEDRG